MEVCFLIHFLGIQQYVGSNVGSSVLSLSLAKLQCERRILIYCHVPRQASKSLVVNLLTLSIHAYCTNSRRGVIMAQFSRKQRWAIMNHMPPIPSSPAHSTLL